jgi:hypothetical protein
MRGGARPGAGRKPVEVNLVELEKLCSLQCTEEEIAAWFAISTRTLGSRRKKRKFAEAMESGRMKGRISVRRHQMKILESGSATMAIWLGRQLLRQRDDVLVEHCGLRRPVEVEASAIAILKSPELLDLAERLAVIRTDGEEGHVSASKTRG